MVRYQVMKTITAIAALLLLSAPPAVARQNIISSLDEKILKKTTHDRIVSLPSRPAKLETGASFACHARPLKGSFTIGEFDSAGNALTAFLKKRGSASAMSTRTLHACLSGHADSCATIRYCLVPLEVRTVKKEKKASVLTVFELDKEGNFVPSYDGRTLASRSVEIQVRFVIIDLTAGAIVWSARISGRAASDDFLMDEGAAAAPGPSRRCNDQSYRCVMYIVDKVKEKLAREFR
jgi:hypothetical protein